MLPITIKSIVKCSKCWYILNEPTDERKPCPACGSLSRLFIEILEQRIVVHDGLTLKARHGEKGKIKPFFEEEIEDRLQMTGKWGRRKMVIDRENDWYEEEVVDRDTGEIIHKCAEPISKHIDHGYAKLKQKI